MGLFDHFPYTNFHELNLSWILEAFKEIETTMDQFVAINALKYADPIQWNITKQYEKNTIVIDPLTGTAYISVQPVPSGVIITNTDYWTIVFDLGRFIVRASKNFTAKYEDATTLTATFPSSVNDWLIWGDVLYKVLSPIVAGDQYVVNSNIQHFTMEDVIGHLEDLSTTDKSNLVAAINEVLQTLNDKVGDLDNLPTTDKSNLVASISEFYTAFNNLGLKSVKDYGAKGDGVTDDTQAFQSAINDLPYGSVLLIPTGNYKLDNVVTIPAGKRITFVGENGNANGSNIYYTTNGAFHNMAEGSSFYNLLFRPQTPHPTSGTAIRVENCYRITIDNCNFIDGFYGIDVRQGSEINIYRCSFLNFTPESDGLAWCIKLGSVGYTAPVQIRDCLFRCLHGSEAHGGITCDNTDGVIIQGCTINSLGFAVTIEPKAGHIAAYTFIDNCVIDNCIYHSILVKTVTGSETWRNHISNCWIGESGWSDITLDAAASTKMHDIQIHDNHHYNSPIALNIASNGDSAYDINYHDNTIEDSSSNAIQLTSGGSHVKMHDNIFDHCLRALSGNTYTRAEFYHNTEIDCTNIDIYGDRIRAGENAGVSWYDYTPTVTAGSGTINSYTVDTAKFEVVESIVHFVTKITITSATTAEALLVTMPRACQSDVMLPARINNKAATAVCTAGYATLVIFDYDGNGAITDGDVFYIEGTYELKTPFDYQ